MIHHLLVLFNSILFFWFSFIAPNGEPAIVTNFPSSMVINQEAVLEIKINKHHISGFATFQMDLPDGFIPREIENAEATCAVNEGQLVWTWNELPEEEELVLSIGLTPNEQAHGKKTIGGSFYYIDNNEKKSIDMTAAGISVLKEGESELALGEGQSTGTATSTPLAPDSHSEPAGLIEVFRTYQEGSGPNEKKIEIKIKKGITKGFARYSDNLEPGYSAKALKTDGSSFSMADGKIKFVWVSVPEKEELTVSYLLICQSETKELNLIGEYSYLEHNQSKKALSPELTLVFQSLDPAPLATPGDSRKSSETPVVNAVEKTSAAVQGRLEKQAKQQQQPTHFAIQVGAFTNTKVNSQTLKRKFKLRSSLKSEFHEGYSKFMFGSFSEYRSARQQREETVNNNGVKSAFVVAYNNGKRITVQEALMILNQKWFK